VAFVSSVGKVHLPANVAPPSLTPLEHDGNDDVADDALSKDFVALLANITRDEVDKHPTKCPHPETAERMTEVRVKIFTLSDAYISSLI
jgi:chorismate synthase